MYQSKKSAIHHLRYVLDCFKIQDIPMQMQNTFLNNVKISRTYADLCKNIEIVYSVLRLRVPELEKTDLDRGYRSTMLNICKRSCVSFQDGQLKTLESESVPSFQNQPQPRQIGASVIDTSAKRDKRQSNYQELRLSVCNFYKTAALSSKKNKEMHQISILEAEKFMAQEKNIKVLYGWMVHNNINEFKQNDLYLAISYYIMITKIIPQKWNFNLFLDQFLNYSLKHANNLKLEPGFCDISDDPDMLCFFLQTIDSSNKMTEQAFVTSYYINKNKLQELYSISGNYEAESHQPFNECVSVDHQLSVLSPMQAIVPKNEENRFPVFSVRMGVLTHLNKMGVNSNLNSIFLKTIQSKLLELPENKDHPMLKNVF
ncbi:MAG: hypothetical protein HAW62_05560, partial [Endozoicomonadaceae bacterium]|nr:hypothetical protein [Endozoicomonadaceae bacterium]